MTPVRLDLATDNSVLFTVLWGIVPLSFFVVFVFYSFCDGFALRPARKVVWAVVFLTYSGLSFLAFGRYVLEFIIPLSSVLAVVLAGFQQKEKRRG